jgi:thymidylate kinase/CYTH domain-containing protein
MKLANLARRTNDDITVIVVTGGPCAGKTSLIDRVVELLQRHDFAVATLTETPTELMQGNISPDLEHLSARQFQERVIKWQILKENFWRESLRMKDAEKQRVLICDRGVFDSLAYTDEKTFNEIIGSFGVSCSELLFRYDLVVHMTTAANGAEEHYTTENNTARTETLQQARELDHATKAAWSNHRNHRVIDNRTGFTEKIMRAIKAFGRVLEMPDAREKERKHLVTDLSRAIEFIEDNNLPGVRLKQAYDEISADIEKRVRRREQMNGGGVEYILTEKASTDDFGEREEKPRDITADEFQEYVRQSDYVVMKKNRYFLFSNGYRFVIDIIEEPVCRAYVEVEVVSMNEDPELPDRLDKVTNQVTGEPKHSAAEIVCRNS